MFVRICIYCNDSVRLLPNAIEFEFMCFVGQLHIMKSSILLSLACLVGVYNSCSAASIVEEIYNGDFAVRGQFPYEVLIHGHNMMGRGYFCGGSLISDTWVMTAGHCCRNVNYTIISAGIVDREDTADAQNFTSTKDNIHLHPNNTQHPETNDICLIELPSAVTTSEYVSIINLPPKSEEGRDTYSGKTATASGWGKTKNNHHGANRYMMYKDVTVVPYRQCKRKVRGIDEKMICSDKTTGGPCSGDSGSPLVLNGTDGKPEVIGLVSYGTGGGCENGGLVVYTQTVAYLDWINEVTGIEVN